MPTEIMDEYLQTLTEPEKSLLREVIEPFHHTASELATLALRDESTIRKEVDLGPVSYIAAGTTSEEVAEREQYLLDHAESLITDAADRAFEEEFLTTPTSCILPAIESLRELHPQYPLFALLIAAHDEDCDHCKANSDEEFEDREEARANIVASLSPEDQRFLVVQGKQFLTTVHNLLPSVLMDILNPETFIAHRLCDEECMYSLGITPECAMWMIRYSNFVHNYVVHGRGCTQTRAKMSEFEKTQLDLLPAHERSIYEEQAFILTRGDAHRLFA